MILLTGDIHGGNDFNRIRTLKETFRRERIAVSKDDTFLIILGDFGVIWENIPDRQEQRLLDIFSTAPWTTLFLDGNHENFSRLKELPQIQKYGATLGKVRDGIYHIPRRSFLTLDDKTFFVHGGGLSIDQDRRIMGYDYWPEELPTTLELDAALQVLEDHGNEVDYILTHEAPAHCIQRITGRDWDMTGILKYKSPLAQFFDAVFTRVEFKMWFCGHYHTECILPEDKVCAMYRNIIRLG